PPHIAPACQGNLLNLGLPLFGKGIAQIGQHQLMTAHARAEAAGEPVGEIDAAVRREQLQEIQKAKDDLCNQPLAEMPDGKHDPGEDELHAGQSILRMILPKICRDSMRSSARSMSLKPTSVSITGCTSPRAIFCMALAMFSIRQPNEPSN